MKEEDGEGGTHLEEGKVIHERSELVQIPARSSIRSIEPCLKLQEVQTGDGGKKSASTLKCFQHNQVIR